MSFWTRFREPSPDDYETDEAYADALEAYERAESQALDEADDARHGI